MFCQCPFCFATYNVAPNLAGTTAPCSACGQHFEISVQSAIQPPAWASAQTTRAKPQGDFNWKPVLLGGGISAGATLLVGAVIGIVFLVRSFLADVAAVEESRENFKTNALQSMVVLQWHDGSHLRQMVAVAVRDGVVAVPRIRDFKTTISSGTISGKTSGPQGVQFEGGQFLHADDHAFFFAVPVPVTPLPLSSEIVLPGAEIVLFSHEGAIESVVVKGDDHQGSFAIHPTMNKTPFLDGCPLLSTKGELVGLSTGTGIHTDFKVEFNSMGESKQVPVSKDKRTYYLPISFVRQALEQLGGGNAAELTAKKDRKRVVELFTQLDHHLLMSATSLQTGLAMHAESNGMIPVNAAMFARGQFPIGVAEGAAPTIFSTGTVLIRQELEQLRGQGDLYAAVVEDLVRLASLADDFGNFNPNILDMQEALRQGKDLLQRYRDLSAAIGTALGERGRAGDLPTDERAHENARALLQNARRDKK